MARILTLKGKGVYVAEDEWVIDESARELKKGNLIVFPTETVYGLMAFGDPQACSHSINLAKERPPETPVAFLVNSCPESEDLLDSLRKKHGEKMEPILAFKSGLVTLVLPKEMLHGILPKEVILACSEFVGIRTPVFGPTNELISRVGGYLLASSANITGRKDPSSLEECKDILSKPQITLAVDGGVVSGEPSAVILISEDEVKIVRHHSRIPKK